jgi:hypothetical protein
MPKHTQRSRTSRHMSAKNLSTDVLFAPQEYTLNSRGERGHAEYNSGG